ncbi:hypothetical protein BJF78_21495 [Pseudonocardia sp. CNS-139]|nr:hypothetical protein BJF78_21495 [Pseudonocardia sp. CNS-139]
MSGTAAAGLAAVGAPAVLAVALLAAAVPFLPAGPLGGPPGLGEAHRRSGPYVRLAGLGGPGPLAVVVDGRPGAVTRDGLAVPGPGGRAEFLARTPDGPPDRPAIIGVAGGRAVRWSGADALTVTGLAPGDPTAVTVRGVSAASPVDPATGTLWVRASADPPGAARLLRLGERDGEQTADATYLPVATIHGPLTSAPVDVAAVVPAGAGAVRLAGQEAGYRLERLTADPAGRTEVTPLAGGLDATCELGADPQRSSSPSRARSPSTPRAPSGSRAARTCCGSARTACCARSPIRCPGRSRRWPQAPTGTSPSSPRARTARALAPARPRRRAHGPAAGPAAVHNRRGRGRTARRPGRRRPDRPGRARRAAGHGRPLGLRRARRRGRGRGGHAAHAGRHPPRRRAGVAGRRRRGVVARRRVARARPRRGAAAGPAGRVRAGPGPGRARRSSSPRPGRARSPAASPGASYARTGAAGCSPTAGSSRWTAPACWAG